MKLRHYTSNTTRCGVSGLSLVMSVHRYVTAVLGGKGGPDGVQPGGGRSNLCGQGT